VFQKLIKLIVFAVVTVMSLKIFIHHSVTVNGPVQLLMELHLTATECHLP